MQLFFNYSIDCELPPNTDYTGPERAGFAYSFGIYDLRLNHPVRAPDGARQGRREAP